MFDPSANVTFTVAAPTFTRPSIVYNDGWDNSQAGPSKSMSDGGGAEADVSQVPKPGLKPFGAGSLAKAMRQRFSSAVVVHRFPAVAQAEQRAPLAARVPGRVDDDPPDPRFERAAAAVTAPFPHGLGEGVLHNVFSERASPAIAAAARQNWGRCVR
jgi:hypothetical protein